MDAAEAADASAPERAGRPARTDRLLALRASVVRRRWFWPAALATGYLTQVLFRLSLVWGNSYPSVHADESSYLVLARVLAGRPTTEMPVGSVIPGGYSLLISPALRFADDPVTAYQLVMGINTLINALVFPLAYVALRRLDVPKGLSVLIAMAAALMPPVVFYSQFAMSDTLLPVVLLGWLITLHGWLSEGDPGRRVRYGVGAGLLAGFSMAVHDRGGVVVALTAAVLVGALVFKWAPLRSTLAAWGALAVSVLGAKLLSTWLEAQFKDQPPSSVGTQVLENLVDPDLLRRTVTRTIGQLWYFSVSSWGFGALAVALCVFAVFSPRFTRASRVVSFVMVALLCGIALAAAAGLPTDDRIDNWVYARYLAPLVPAFFLVGVTVLWRARAGALLRLVLGAVLLTVVTAEFVILVVGKGLYRLNIIQWAMPDALFLASEWTKLHMWRTIAGALLVLGACVLFRLAGGRRVIWAVAVSLALFATYATATVTSNVAGPYIEYRKPLAIGFTESTGLKPGENLVMDWDVDWGLRMAQTYEVYEGRVWTRDLEHGEEPPAQADAAVLQLTSKDAKAEDTWLRAPAGWYVAKADKTHGWVLWRRR
ncbi:hypothetical protein J7F03_02025 [Streptomyces sp. ISL-43]|uniref:hypothetical protein n=1 Tax=Streptomyces sp. ISL-43 TaxID=2819183 RepID=UPI001BEA09EA|nr:hypothetical protein [Streptomyces sp. ISL-43]MBT2445885.1 hypothetical protein [Streptomyces sp. ISL-43]